MRIQSVRIAASLLAMAALSACGSSTTYDESRSYPPPPPTGSISRTLEMVDGNGVHYGTVEMNPIGGGKVYDASGQLIGDIVPPPPRRRDEYYDEQY